MGDTMSVCTTVDRLIADFTTRAEFGQRKYGKTVGEAQYGDIEWIKHTRDELMDACVYLTKLIEIHEDAHPPETFMNR